MSVTITNTGSNSRKLEIANEYNINAAGGIIEGINTALTALGWTLYDTVTTGSRNCFVTKVYTAACNDGGSPSIKYMILRFDGPRRFWYVSCAESWNDTTHVATNECWTQERSFPLPLQLNNSIIYVWANARYAIFQGSVRGELGLWQGIVEFERTMIDDSPSQAPCFGYTNQLIIGSPYYYFVPGASSTVDTDIDARNHIIPLWMPRAPDGTTGYQAIRSCSIVIGNTPYPPSNRTVLYNSNTASLFSNTLQRSLGLGIASINPSSFVYNGNTSLRPVMDMRVGSQVLNYFEYGRLYGLKLTTNLGSPLDTFALPVDGNLFFSNTGSNNSHFILPITGGGHTTVSVGAGRMYQELMPVAGTNTTIFDTSGLVHGRFIYNTAGTGTNTQANVVIKIDLDTGTWSNIAVPGTAEGIIYDGGNNVYVSTGVGVSRINVTDDSIANLSSNLAGGGSAMTVNDTYLFLGPKTAAATNNKVDVINLSTFTVETQINNIIVALHGGTNATGQMAILTTPDYDSNNMFIAIGAMNINTRIMVNRIFANGVIAGNVHIDWAYNQGQSITNAQYGAMYYNNKDIIVLWPRGPGTANSSSGTAHYFSITTDASLANTQTGLVIDGGHGHDTLAHPYKISEAIPVKGYRFGNGHRGDGTGSIPSIISVNHHHVSNTEASFGGMYSAAVRNLYNTSGNTTYPYGPVSTDGCSVYRMFTSQNSGVLKGQYNQTRNNVGVTTPVLLIPS